MKRVAWTLHLWFGVGLGLYVATVCLTGSILIYKDALERRTGHGYLAPVPSTTLADSWHALQKTVSRAHPRGQFTHLEFPENAGEAPFFRLVEGGDRIYVFVNPYTNQILGEDTPTNGISAFVYDLHVNLLSGGSGRTINGIGALAILVVLTTGLIVWWPRPKSWHRGFLYERKARWERQTVRLHRLTGVLMSIPLIVIMFTGVYLVFGDPFRQLAGALSPQGAWFDTPRVADGKTPPLPLDELIAKAHAAMPEATPRVFRFSTSRSAAWHLRLALPGDWSRSGSQFVYINQYSGEIVRREAHGALPLAVRFIRSQSPIHFGSFADSWSRLLWTFAGVAGTALALSGTLMFVLRLRAKAQRFR